LPHTVKRSQLNSEILNGGKIMFLTFFPLVPLALAGGILFRNRILAYGVPVAMIVCKSFFTDFSIIHLFTLLPLLAAVFGIRKALALKKTSVAHLAGYAVAAILGYEIFSSFGVWLMGNCLAGYSAIYPHTLKGLIDGYAASLPFTAIHFLRDVPLGVLMMSGALFFRKKYAVAILPKCSCERS